MVVSEIKLYEMLKAKLGEKEAEAFVDLLESKVNTKFEESKNILTTKEDLAREIGNVKAEIANVKAELIKWMFVFWIGTIGVLSGIMFAMLNAYLK